MFKWHIVDLFSWHLMHLYSSCISSVWVSMNNRVELFPETEKSLSCEGNTSSGCAPLFCWSSPASATWGYVHRKEEKIKTEQTYEVWYCCPPVRQWWSLPDRRRRWVDLWWISHTLKVCRWLSVHLCAQDRINREVVNVTTLPIPAELSGLLHAASGTRTQTHTWLRKYNRPVHWVSSKGVHLCHTGGVELHSDCLAVVQAPKVEVDPQLTLPLDINNYLMTHYIQAMYRVRFLSQCLKLKHLLLKSLTCLTLTLKSSWIILHLWQSSHISNMNKSLQVIKQPCLCICHHRSHCLGCSQPHWRIP